MTYLGEGQDILCGFRSGCSGLSSLCCVGRLWLGRFSGLLLGWCLEGCLGLLRVGSYGGLGLGGLDGGRNGRGSGNGCGGGSLSLGFGGSSFGLLLWRWRGGSSWGSGRGRGGGLGFGLGCSCGLCRLGLCSRSGLCRLGLGSWGGWSCSWSLRGLVGRLVGRSLLVLLLAPEDGLEALLQLVERIGSYSNGVSCNWNG
ncbi:hypothetical protein BDW69DRAFT_166771 [Aspergillus filifer]